MELYLLYCASLSNLEIIKIKMPKIPNLTLKVKYLNDEEDLFLKYFRIEIKLIKSR